MKSNGRGVRSLFTPKPIRKDSRPLIRPQEMRKTLLDSPREESSQMSRRYLSAPPLLHPRPNSLFRREMATRTAGPGVSSRECRPGNSFGPGEDGTAPESTVGTDCTAHAVLP